MYSHVKVYSVQLCCLTCCKIKWMVLGIVSLNSPEAGTVKLVAQTVFPVAENLCCHRYAAGSGQAFAQIGFNEAAVFLSQVIGKSRQ